MTDDLVERLRLQADTSLMRLPEDHVYVSHGEAADRIEQLEKTLLEIANAVGDPSAYWIARAALEKKHD